MNVAVKMFSGCYAYAPVRTCEKKETCRCSLERAVESVEDTTRLTFVGLSELWELSLLLLYHRFPSLHPEKEEFHLQNVRRSDVVFIGPRMTGKGGRGASGEQLLDYNEFKKVAESKPSFQKALANQNALDLKLYKLVVMRFERELRQAGLLGETMVEEALKNFKEKFGERIA